MRISVIGTGCAGLVHALWLARGGHEVLGLDRDGERIAALSQGRSPVHEPGLGELLCHALDSGRLRFTTSLSEAAWFAGVHFVCPGTPRQPGPYTAALRYVEGVIDELAPLLLPGDLVVGRAAVPAGAAARLTRRLRELARRRTRWWPRRRYRRWGRT